MTPLGAYLFAWFGVVVIGSLALALVARAVKSPPTRFACTVLIGALWSSPFFGLALKQVLEGTDFEFGPPITRHRSGEGLIALLAIVMGVVILRSSVRVARQDRDARIGKPGSESPRPP